MLDTFLQSIIDGAYQVLCEPEDHGQVLTLVRKYQNLPLGYADAAVVVCAKRNGGNVLTTDKHFWIVASEGISLLLPTW